MATHKRPSVTNSALSYLPTNVYEQALKRIRWIYNEFGKVCVSSSGGKDSTVVLELTLQVAQELGIEKVPVLWLDQECEFATTVNYMTEVMERSTVDPYWMQIPFRLFNATSTEHEWLNVWGEGEEWVRDKHPLSHKENVYGTDRFKELLHVIQDYHHEGYAIVTGVRAEESPARKASLTSLMSYKWITWGTKSKKHPIFHPIYDWRWRDIWKAIYDNDWNYNRHYDHLYSYGVPIHEMRVSNYHHETAVRSLFLLQEIEPETYAKAVKRLRGISTAAHLGYDDYFVKELPFMFSSWKEYRDYLLRNLLPESKWATFEKEFKALEDMLIDYGVTDQKEWDRVHKVHVQSIVVNDVDFTKMNNMKLEMRPRLRAREF